MKAATLKNHTVEGVKINPSEIVKTLHKLSNKVLENLTLLGRGVLSLSNLLNWVVQTYAISNYQDLSKITMIKPLTEMTTAKWYDEMLRTFFVPLIGISKSQRRHHCPFFFPWKRIIASSSLYLWAVANITSKNV